MVLGGCVAGDDALPGDGMSDGDIHDAHVVGDAPDGDAPEDPGDALPPTDEDADEPDEPDVQGGGNGGCADGELALECSTMVAFMDDAQLLIDDLFADDDCRLVHVQGGGLTAHGIIDSWAHDAAWRITHRCEGRDVVLIYAPEHADPTAFPMLQAYATDAAAPDTWEGPWVDSDELMSDLREGGCVDPDGETMSLSLTLTTEGPELALYVVHQAGLRSTLATDEEGAAIGAPGCD